MRRVLVDTNVVLDVLPGRELSESTLAAHAVTIIHYLYLKVVAALLNVFGEAPVDGSVLEAALHLPLADFEGSVAAVAAQHSGCDLIVTRDPKRFRGSPLQSLSPEEALPLLAKR